MNTDNPVLLSEPTKVPLTGNRDVTIDPGSPWPSPYRGSKYSLIHSNKFSQFVLQWQYDDLQIYLEPPDGLVNAMQSVGKSNGSGTGSFRITAGREVLTKVHVDHYVNSSDAPTDSGWAQVYLGKLQGELPFTDVDINPDTVPSKEVRVWEGLPFHHGETWAVSVYDKLVWKWQGYRFESPFEHPEIVSQYAKYRRTPGRLYINENGRIWVNVPRDGIPEGRREEVINMFSDWHGNASKLGKDSIQRLVNRRLKATGGGDTSKGHLPIYIGHVSDFDDGLVPRPVVDDPKYFVDAGREREDT